MNDEKKQEGCDLDSGVSNSGDVDSFNHPLYRRPIRHLVTATTDYTPLTDEEIETLVRKAIRVREVRLEQARRDPNAFIEYCFEDANGNPFVQAWFHEDWQQFISEHRRSLIIAPRNHGKTSQVVGRVLWELGKDHNLRIKIVCASDSKATERLFEIVQHMQYNPRVKEVFPDLSPAQYGDFTKHKIVVKRTARHRDASIEALGICSTATGGRADLIVADDICDRRNSLAFPALRKMIKDAWFSDWTQLLEPSGRVIYICTLWHKADLSHNLAENEEYSVMRYDVTSDLRPIWPEVWSREKLEQRKREIGEVEFDRAFRNVAQDTSKSIIRPEWVKYVTVTRKMIKKQCFVVLSYDVACGRRKSENDSYFACVVFAVDKNCGHIYVIDAYQLRMSVPEQEAQIINDWRVTGAEDVVVEAVGGFDGVPQHLQLAEPDMNVVRVKPEVDKIMRMNRASLYLFNGMVSFSGELDPAELKSADRGDLVGQLYDFPIGTKNDLCDAFSQGVVYCARRYIDFRENEPGEVNVYVIDGSEKRGTRGDAEEMHRRI